MVCYKTPVQGQKRGFEEVEHTADWALRVQGRDLCELLGNAAWGMSHLLVAEPAAIPSQIEQQFEIEAYDPESLLVGWLSELAYWAEIEGVVFGEFELQIVTPTRLEGTARGNRVSDLQKHIKAVTYHNLVIVESEAGLETTIVFDV